MSDFPKVRHLRRPYSTLTMCGEKATTNDSPHKVALAPGYIWCEACDAAGYEAKLLESLASSRDDRKLFGERVLTILERIAVALERMAASEPELPSGNGTPPAPAPEPTPEPTLGAPDLAAEVLASLVRANTPLTEATMRRLASLAEQSPEHLLNRPAIPGCNCRHCSRKRD